MKNLLNRVQDLSQKAAHLKAALETAPPKIAALKESVTATASQLGQLRGEIQEALSGLRTEGDASLSRALQEIDNHSPLFPKAGYTIETLESELGLVPRLVVRLRKFDDVPASTLRSLITTPGLPTCIQAILASMLKAAETAERAGLVTLEYDRLTVSLGISPSMRISWSPPDTSTPSSPLPPSPAQSNSATPPTPPTPPVSSFPSALGEGSFFQPRTRPQPTASSAIPNATTLTPSPAATPAAPTVPPPPTPTPYAYTHPTATAGAGAAPSPASADPLARFKRMPKLTK